MRKLHSLLLTVTAAGLALGLAFPLSNLVGIGAEHLDVVGDEGFVQASQIIQGKCVDCHAPSIAALPLYAYFPGVSGLIRSDQTRGSSFWELTADELQGKAPVSEAKLAKLEVALNREDMPPTKYVALHWTANVSATERELLDGYIHARRAATPEAQRMAERHRGEPLRPLVRPTGLSEKKVALGRDLYHDTRLSGDGTLSCASCHDLRKGGCDQAPSSTGIRGQLGPINSPTVLNASYNVLQFWDGRARDLVEQAGGPVENPLEMGAKFPAVVAKLAADETMAARFTEVYGARGVSKESITDAIAEFERSLVTVGSRFDAYLEGKDDALSPEEREGYETFKAAGCTGCHFGPAAGGQSFERMGRTRDYFADRGNPTAADDGRFAVTKEERDRHVFKVPILRNIGSTHPYFHDGSVREVSDAIRKMGRYQLVRELTDAEVDRIVLFLNTLEAPVPSAN